MSQPRTSKGIGRFAARRSDRLTQQSVEAPAPNDAARPTVERPTTAGTEAAFAQLDRPNTGGSDGFGFTSFMNYEGTTFGGQGKDSGDYSASYELGVVGRENGDGITDFCFGNNQGDKATKTTEKEVPTPPAGVSKFSNRLRASIDPSAAPATPDENLLQLQEAKNVLDATNEAVSSPKATDMDLDVAATGFDILENSQDAPLLAIKVQEANAKNPPNATLNPEDFSDPAQETPKVPESISEDGKEDVQDDLTTTSYISGKETDNVPMEKGAKPSVPVVDGNVGVDKWIAPNDNAMMGGKPKTTAGVERTDSPKKQTVCKAASAARVSLSPPPNAANRNAAIGTEMPNLSPAAMSKNISDSGNQMNLENVGLVDSDVSNDTGFSLDNAEDSNGVSAAGLADTNCNANKNQHGAFAPAPSDQYNDVSMMDDDSIIVPGQDPVPRNEYQPETLNMAQFGTDANVFDGFDASMDLGLDAGKDSFDMHRVKDTVENRATNTNAAISAPTQTRINDNFGVQDQGQNRTRPSMVNTSASLGVRTTGSMANRHRNKPYSLIQPTKNASNTADAGSSNNPNPRATKTVNDTHSQLSRSVTPPGGRSGALRAPGARSIVPEKQANTAITPEAIAQNRARASMSTPAGKMQTQHDVQASKDRLVHLTIPPDASNFSPPPSGNKTISTTPKMSNMQAQSLANQQQEPQMNLIADPSYSNLSFDQLLHQFVEDIQEVNDLHMQGNNDLLDLEVELTHAMAAGLRYKGDMMDLLDEIESTQASAMHLLTE